MTADIKLLPLPEVPADDDVLYAWAEDYARANMEPLLAENERLRAEAAREFERSARLGGQLHESQARAERLAEALEMMMEMVRMGGFGKDAAMDTARAALDQEGGNG